MNTCTDYRERYFHRPTLEQSGDGYIQEWIVYGNEYIGGKRLTVDPGKTVVIKDQSAYGCVLVQGHGKIGNYDCESPTLIRYGELTADEFFVSKDASAKGVRIENKSKYEPLVFLKHCGPDGGMI